MAVASGRRRSGVRGRRLDRFRGPVPDRFVLGAIRRQQGRSRRAVAAIGAAVLLLVGWLGARHEAEVAHVRDQRGDVVHAEELAGHHEVDRAAHLHGREDHAHAPGACELVALAHASLVAAQAPAGLALAVFVEELGAPVAVEAGGTIAGYLIAPKTSPPALA